MTWYYLFLLLLTDSIFRYLLIFLFFIFLLFFLSFFLFTFQVRDWSFGGGVFGCPSRCDGSRVIYSIYR